MEWVLSEESVMGYDSLKNNYEFIPSFTKKIFKEVLKIN